jgi:glyoxylase-like metal-dependent hydrolase (beta-lactamase superfamily II)
MPSEPNPALSTLGEGIVRLTWSIPLGIPHVHCYLVPVEDGWLLVDTGLGLPGAEAAWTAALDSVDGPVVSIVVTHSHPDHVGGAADVALITGAPVSQGRLDYQRCLSHWGNERAGAHLADHLLLHGAPDVEARRIGEATSSLLPLVHFARDPQLLDEGDLVHGWRVLHLPGHADGHICLLRDGVLLAGDAILDPITPTVGLFPGGAPDPLADYLASLARIVELRPRVAYAGHGRPIPDPPARAEEIQGHHGERLVETVRALESGPRSAWDVSHALFPEPLPPPQRRFAVVETLAHLEHLVRHGRVSAQQGDVMLYSVRSG